MKGIQEFSFGSGDQGFGGGKSRFKLDTDQSARISLAWWATKEVNGITVLDLDSQPKFVGGARHFIKGVGFILNQGPEYTKLAGEPPKKRVGTIVVQWPLTARGELDKEAIKAGDFWVKSWVFDDQKYDTIRPLHDEWGLGSYDLKVKCQDSQYQKMTFSIAKESLLRGIMGKGPDAKGLIDRIVTEVQNLSANLGDEIGRSMTIDEIRQKMAGGGTPMAGGGGRPSTPAAGESTSEDVDSLVDDLLG